MSPGAQSMGQKCSLLIQKVVQSTEPEACAVSKSGRVTQATRYPILHGKRQQVTPNMDPELDSHLPMSSTSQTHRGSGGEYGLSNMQLLGQQLEKEERNRGSQCIMENPSAV